MNKKLGALLVTLMIISFSVFLFGCKHETIKFYRESAASNVINKFKNENNKNDKRPASGVVILKDDSQQKGREINFGPQDINFDMPVRFK